MLWVGDRFVFSEIVHVKVRAPYTLENIGLTKCKTHTTENLAFKDKTEKLCNGKTIKNDIRNDCN